VTEENRIREALTFIPPADREMWVKLAMAVKSELGEAGFDLWDTWGQGAGNYDPAAAKAVWKSAKAGGKTRIGTLFHLARLHGWQDSGARPAPRAAELEAQRRAAAERAEREAAEEKRRQALARRKANGMWNHATEGGDDHPYLLRKRVRAHGLRVGIWQRWIQDGAGRWVPEPVPGCLLVPTRSASGTLHSLQAIYPEKIDGRDKDYLPHGRKSGCFHLIGEVADGLPLCIAEGYATSATVHEATGWPVAVAFDAGNLEPVARALREKHPAISMIVAGDDDHLTEGNPGRTRAEAAARAVGGVVVLPEFGPDRPEPWTDFNDLSISERPGEGEEAVHRILLAARATAERLPPQPAEPPAAAGGGGGAGPGGPPADPPAGQAPAAPPPAEGDRWELIEAGEGAGVWRVKYERRREGTWDEVRTLVCAPLAITAMVRDRHGCGWQRLAMLRDHDGRERRVLLADDLLEGDGLALARLLRGHGLWIADNRGGLLKMYINNQRPATRARRTPRIGWHEDVDAPGCWSYVMGGDHPPIAPKAAELWLHDGLGAGHAQFRPAGALADWQDHVAALAVGNTRLCFALSAGLAAGLIWLHPNIAGGIHWAGGSSLGKSALLFATASLCGPPSYRRTWALTGAATEATAAGHCDAPLLLDELKQSGTPREVAQAAYLLASGQGKGRGRADGGLRDISEFRLLFQSNGEIGLTQFLEDVGERSYAGQEVRFCELPGDAGAGHGCWENLHGHVDGARFSEGLQRHAARYYGTAYPEFIRHVVAEREALVGQFEALRTEFEHAVLSDRAGGQARRVAVRFAAVAFAGELATAWGITGWPRGEALKAALRLFHDWLDTFGGEENREPRRMVEQVRAWIQAHAVMRLEDWRRPATGDSHAPRTANRAGWRRPTAETKCLSEADQVFEYLIYPAVFRTELCAGFDPTAVGKVLVARGLMERSEKKMATKHREPGAKNSSDFYLLKPEVLGTNDAD
jgi:putative DNA primase/helicase